MDSLRYSLSPFNISVTNLNAGPVKTSFTERFGNVAMGGKGTREIKDDDGNYLQVKLKIIIAFLYCLFSNFLYKDII